MTTLAANKERRYTLTHLDFNELPAIGSDILYWGSAIGKVAGTGYMRPLVAGDKFVGFFDAKADNNTGSRRRHQRQRPHSRPYPAQRSPAR
jgi:hypothetical protein